jgi:hypothetical protein
MLRMLQKNTEIQSRERATNEHFGYNENKPDGIIHVFIVYLLVLHLDIMDQ